MIGTRAMSGSDAIRFRKRCMQATESSMARSEEHTSELQSLMRISYAVLCLKKKKKSQEDTIQNAYESKTNNNQLKSVANLHQVSKVKKPIPNTTTIHKY